MAAKQTFTWMPIFDSEKTTEPTVSVVQFGEGYELRQAIGLNSIKPEWSLTFENVPAEILKIEKFLEARGGVEAFYFKNPDDKTQTLTVVCSRWSKVRHTGYHTLQCAFRRVYEQ